MSIRNENRVPKSRKSPNPNGRTVTAGTENDGAYLIKDWQPGGGLRWACAVSDADREPDTRRLLVRLLVQDRESRSTALKVFGPPALLTRATEATIEAKRRELLGASSLRADRSTRRLVQGDSRASTLAVGA